MAREKTYDDILASFVPKVRLSFENLFPFTVTKRSLVLSLNQVQRLLPR